MFPSEKSGVSTGKLQIRPLMSTVAYTTFCRLWRVLLPSIIIMKPMSDLCWQCQQNSTAILRAANSPDAEKFATLKDAEEHLRIVQLERSFYKTKCDECNSSQFQQRPSPLLLQLCTTSALIPFSLAPFSSFPPPPPPPRKCSIFGVHCEALPRQINSTFFLVTVGRERTQWLANSISISRSMWHDTRKSPCPFSS